MNDTPDLGYAEHSYGDHELQRLGVWRWKSPSDAQHPVTGDPAALPAAPKPKTKYWLVYIHGGIWRDPRITHLQAQSAVGCLGAAHRARIAGFASLDYRLSPHPEFPQDRTSTDPRQLRDARHPDHLRDVRRALAFLGRRFGVGDGPGETPYVLYGHSCGATLALQVAMGLLAEERGRAAGQGAEEVPVPAAVVGLQGMYDLAGLNARFGGAYRDMIAGAFGHDQEVWKEVSPARFEGKFCDSWDAYRKDRGIVMLAYSTQDEWIDMAEIDAMEQRLRREVGQGPLVQTRRDLTGGHDAVAEDGQSVVAVLMETVDKLDNLRRNACHGG